MYLFEIDRKHNRMHIMLADHFTEAEAENLHQECKARIGEINTDCRILCDFTTLEIFEHKAKLIYRKVMDLCNSTGAKKVIRVFSDPMETFGMNIMSYFHYDEKVQIRNCSTLSQAIRYLE